MKRLLAAAMLGCLLAGPGRAAIDIHEFDSEAQRARYRHLAEVLRCPKCQNQNIADSNSPIANDLRREVHRMLREGRSDEQIIDFMVARYGDFVLYRPPLDTRTAVLWIGPAALLAAGAGLVGVLVLRGRRARADAAALSDDERRRLAGLLRASRDNGTAP
ncbi:cytochrome c-type biogenesis protein [Bordetella petrii]|uniref:cytochrome c-type biogenesis protein n=1 Tax=Bordetella petrii TaxID=94624 RepID=UPI001A95744D|nr:cytochrome c-type biogenesis protein [Bordetella petrii]MBO1113967.1 cytochrome c-type biogenesis protein CcmH [Bordetella petrii]